MGRIVSIKEFRADSDGDLSAFALEFAFLWTVLV
jgi:hypothetical protein